MSSEKRPQIVVVGGGAGGLELATRLGKRLGKRKKADVILIDMDRTHIWKPLLHEVAAGSLDVGEEELEYLAQARFRHFRFRLGRMIGLDRERREVQLAATYDEHGEEVIPERRFPYDILVLAVGSLSNDFGIPGVKEHCLFLDTTAQAEYFQRRLLNTMLHAHTQGRPIEPGQLDVAIIGAGATGVELAAQIHRVSRLLPVFGLDEIDPERHVRITIVEAADKILPALPPRLSSAAVGVLQDLGVSIRTGQRVVEVTPEGIHTADHGTIPAAISVWAAGIKAPDFLAELGLETNRVNQVLVRQTLQTTVDDDIYVIGDAAACPVEEGSSEMVPARAQAAHQQADLVARSICRRLRGSEHLPKYRYRDYGSLVALGQYSTVGNLMGGLVGRSMMISGLSARLVYLSLYKMHQAALFGWPRTVLITLVNLLRRGVDPEVKLH